MASKKPEAEETTKKDAEAPAKDAKVEKVQAKAKTEEVVAEPVVEEVVAEAPVAAEEAEVDQEVKGRGAWQQHLANDRVETTENPLNLAAPTESEDPIESEPRGSSFGGTSVAGSSNKTFKQKGVFYTDGISGTDDRDRLQRAYFTI